jgi:hypothetical protein
MARPRRDARRNSHLPIASRTAADPGRNFSSPTYSAAFGEHGLAYEPSSSNFIIVSALGALYVHLSGLPILTAIFSASAQK